MSLSLNGKINHFEPTAVKPDAELSVGIEPNEQIFEALGFRNGVPISISARANAISSKAVIATNGGNPKENTASIEPEKSEETPEEKEKKQLIISYQLRYLGKLLRPYKPGFLRRIVGTNYKKMPETGLLDLFNKEKISVADICALAERFGVEENAFMLGDLQTIPSQLVANVIANIITTKIGDTDAGLAKAVELLKEATATQRVRRTRLNIETKKRVDLTTGDKNQDFIEIPAVTSGFEIEEALGQRHQKLKKKLADKLLQSLQTK